MFGETLSGAKDQEIKVAVEAPKSTTPGESLDSLRIPKPAVEEPSSIMGVLGKTAIKVEPKRQKKKQSPRPVSRPSSEGNAKDDFYFSVATRPSIGWKTIGQFAVVICVVLLVGASGLMYWRNSRLETEPNLEFQNSQQDSESRPARHIASHVPAPAPALAPEPVTKSPEIMAPKPAPSVVKVEKVQPPTNYKNSFLQIQGPQGPQKELVFRTDIQPGSKG